MGLQREAARERQKRALQDAAGGNAGVGFDSVIRGGTCPLREYVKTLAHWFFVQYNPMQ
ncbi:hypothetical protein D3C86_825690 [compost metagenome]